MNGPKHGTGKEHRGHREPAGNFHYLDRLLAELGSPPVFRLGHPLPQDRYLPRRAGSCPETHNRALLPEDAD